MKWCIVIALMLCGCRTRISEIMPDGSTRNINLSAYHNYNRKTGDVEVSPYVERSILYGLDKLSQKFLESAVTSATAQLQ